MICQATRLLGISHDTTIQGPFEPFRSFEPRNRKSTHLIAFLLFALGILVTALPTIYPSLETWQVSPRVAAAKRAKASYYSDC